MLLLGGLGLRAENQIVTLGWKGQKDLTSVWLRGIGLWSILLIQVYLDCHVFPALSRGPVGFYRLQGLSINRYSTHIREGELEGSRLSERITVSIELEFLNKYLFNALKRSLYNANPKKKLDIIYYYSRDPLVILSISII